MSAFVVIGAVLGTVAGWVPMLAADRQASQPDRLVREVGELPDYSIVDRNDRVIACSVPRFDIVMSPRSMWQAHTPDYMAARISELLCNEPSEAVLLDRMLPDDVDGWIQVDAWDLDPRRAHQVQQWIDGDEHRAALPGIQLATVKTEGTERFRVFWNPEILLARELRLRHGAQSAATWGRRIADGLANALRAPDEHQSKSAQGFSEAREFVWRALFPSAYTRPVMGMPQELALALRDLLVEEGVSPWQMRIAYASERVYPSGESELFGSWGFPDKNATDPMPTCGLELAASRLLEDTAVPLEASADIYEWHRDRNIRGARANAFEGFTAASEVPKLRSTIDLGLQAFVGETLGAVMEEHRPALAMAIVVDTDSSEVLAVEGMEGYDISPFAPIYHTFTPGSTFKVITMAVALDKGVVRPTTVFDVGPADHYRLVVDLGPGKKPGGRTIHEAEGSLSGEITAAEALAWSVNAGLVQIGLRLSSEEFRDYLTRLGYGSAPGSRLGVEKRGALRKLPWKRTYTHASISFGHELTTTLWQHAGALTTVLRGGVLRPLRLFASVEQGKNIFPLGLAEGSRVFAEQTSEQVRAMMRLGAAEGTGAPILGRMSKSERWRDAAESLAGIELGTKTATAQKVGGEVCLHVELAARERWEANGTPVTKALFKGLKSAAKPHKNCYTSSVCAFGRSPVTGKEIMVLVVVDEPRGKEKFGSKVAGPAAFAVLAESMQLTRAGAPFQTPRAAGFVGLPPSLEERTN